MKRFFTTALATLMAVSMAVPAFGGHSTPSGNIQGVGTVDIQPIEIMVPTNLDFTLDPFLSSGNVSQVAGDPFILWNNSGTPVTVQFQLLAIPGEGVTLVEEMDPDDRFSPANTTKTIAFGAQVASDIPALTAGAAPTTAAPDFEEDHEELNEGDELFMLSAWTNATAPAGTNGRGPLYSLDFGFALYGRADGATTGTLAAVTNAQIGAFQFYADMHALAPWEEGRRAPSPLTLRGRILVAPNLGGDPVEGDIGFNSIDEEYLVGGLVADAIALARNLGILNNIVTFGDTPVAADTAGRWERVNDTTLSIGRARELSGVGAPNNIVITMAGGAVGTTITSVTQGGVAVPAGQWVLATNNLTINTAGLERLAGLSGTNIAPVIITLSNDDVLTVNVSR